MQTIQEETEYIEALCPRCKEPIPEGDWGKPVLHCPYCGLMYSNPTFPFEESEEYADIPKISVHWYRFKEHISYRKASAWLALGIRGSGKSSFLECISIRYPKIIDLYGSSDMEALCWCKPQFEKVWRAINGKAPKILLISGNDREISSRFSTCHISEITLQKIEEQDVITTCQQFFNSEDEYFKALAHLVNLLWTQRHCWTEPIFVLVREASNWLYSRAKVVKNDNRAKAEFIKAFRESRHHGLAMACDTLRWTAIDKEIRDIADYTIIKRTGATGLPDDLRWLYRYYRFFDIMRLHNAVAVISTAKGAMGKLDFDYPAWHKEEHENMLKICNIEVKRIDSVVPDDRTYNTGAFEHAEMIKGYIELQSMDKVAELMARTHQTVRNHIKDHNTSIRSLGKCMKCYNAHGEFAETHVTVRGVGRRSRAETKKLAEQREEKAQEKSPKLPVDKPQQKPVKKTIEKPQAPITTPEPNEKPKRRKLVR